MTETRPRVLRESTGKMIIDDRDSDDEAAKNAAQPSRHPFREDLTSVDGFTRGANGKTKLNEDSKKRRREENATMDTGMSDVEPMTTKAKEKDESEFRHGFKSKRLPTHVLDGDDVICWYVGAPISSESVRGEDVEGLDEAVFEMALRDLGDGRVDWQAYLRRWISAAAGSDDYGGCLHVLDNRGHFEDMPSDANFEAPLSKRFKRSASPAPSEPGEENRSKSWMQKLKRFSKSTSSLPLASSTENPGGGTSLGKYLISSLHILNSNPVVDHPNVIAPDGISPNRSSLIIDPSQHPDHSAIGSHVATSSAAPNLLFPEGPTQTTPASQASGHTDKPAGIESSPQSANPKAELSLKEDLKLTGNSPAGQAPGEDIVTAGYATLTPYNLYKADNSNFIGIAGDSQPANPKPESSLKKNLKFTGRVLQTVFAKAVDIYDTDPVKVALSLVKTIIEIKNAVKDNNDGVARQIASTGGQLEEVAKALEGWKLSNQEKTEWMKFFKVTLEEELGKLKELSDERNWKKVLDHEDEQARIKDIFVRINEARVRFELALGIRVFKAVYKIEQAIEDQILDRLKPSHIAHHDYTGAEGQVLSRRVCTPGTRVRILGDIVKWANNTSLDCPNVYWLFGHAGSGKSTLAYTIARCFEFAGDSDDTTILGGNFFCSRQFPETCDSIYIIRTIVYHLALKCKPFSDALLHSNWRRDVINHNHRSQLDSLLFKPWEESETARSSDASTPPCYLIVIDALDEIAGSGGSDFLCGLIDKINEKGLSGLKFFITSREDKSIVEDVESLEEKQKQLYCLRDVEEEEASADVATYLRASLPDFVGPDMDQLVAQAAGLFIYASTVVKEEATA
ncbi:hypothetical protein D9619_009645 [Psilocybe cf. subviscida]|uniref:Nephrocystin 3-like N-terminal domain-containing protein n=1 Tax=Psilocybe cf. subviscida TaxID=2480587 RepID=A0A8H5BKU8_9AGAR|nr:hypothetical protein D9619_009645 [Psilocybe cf. subviscida]